MRLPFVLPKRLIVTVDINPVRLHVIERVLSTLVGEETTNIRVRPGRIAILGESQVTVVGPQAVDSPTIGRSSRRLGIPELSLQEKASRRFKAAKVRDDGSVGAGRDASAAARRRRKIG